MKSIITITLIFLNLSIYSQSFEIDNIIYEVSNLNNVQAIDYTGENGASVNIPNQVNHNGTNYIVSSIGFRAFAFHQLSNVNIPNSVVEIGIEAFGGNNFTTINIPNSVKIIDHEAFFGSIGTNIESLTIPSSVESIGDAAFFSNKLKKLTISNGVKTLHNRAFGNNELATVTIPESITTINGDPFFENPIETVTSLSEIPSILSDNAFLNRNNVDLFIPVNTSSIYTNNNWINFKSITEINPPTLSNNNVINNDKPLFIIDRTNGFIKFDYNKNNIKKISLYDISGNLVLSEKRTAQISINLIDDGIYIVLLEIQKNIIVKKIIKY